MVTAGPGTVLHTLPSGALAPTVTQQFTASRDHRPAPRDCKFQEGGDRANLCSERAGASTAVFGTELRAIHSAWSLCSWTSLCPASVLLSSSAGRMIMGSTGMRNGENSVRGHVQRA